MKKQKFYTEEEIKEMRNARQRRYIEKNREKYNAYRRDLYRRNMLDPEKREKLNESFRKYRAKKREKERSKNQYTLAQFMPIQKAN